MALRGITAQPQLNEDGTVKAFPSDRHPGEVYVELRFAPASIEIPLAAPAATAPAA